MAKYCTKCGKELKNGKACSCQKQAKQEVIENTDIKESFMNCLNVLKKIFTKPFEVIEEFVTENHFITGIIMIVVTAISTGIYKIATLKNIYSSNSSIDSFNVNDLSGLFSNALSGNLSSLNEPEYLKEFMTTFATNLVEYALIAAIGYLIITKLLKGTSSLKEIVSAVGISLAVVLCANLLNSILVFIDGEFVANLRSYILSFTGILSTLILYVSIKKVAGISKERLFVTVASMSVFATIIIDLFNKIIND